MLHLAHAIRLQNEHRTRVSRLIMDVFVPVSCCHSHLTARIAVVELTRLSRPRIGINWHVVGRRYICGTNYGLYVKGIDFPFRTFTPYQYDHLDNPYEAANQYTQRLAGLISPLILRRDALKYLYLAKTK